jgi:hypothetical protein
MPTRMLRRGMALHRRLLLLLGLLRGFLLLL